MKNFWGGALLGIGVGEICMSCGIDVFSLRYFAIMACIVLGVNFIIIEK